MLFQLNQVHKSYGAHEVLKGASFQVNPGERVGLVGHNGAGKTTIFRLVAGDEEPDRGTVTRLRNVRIALLEQQPSFTGKLGVREEALSVFHELNSIEREMSRLEHLMAEVDGPELDQAMHSYSDLRHRYEIAGGFTYQPRAESVLNGLGFSGEELSKPADQLSGGQKARLALAKLLLSEPDLLLLDEPTNHLDVAAVEWLEEFLAEYKAAFVVISHDRFLLDRIATKIVEVSSGKTTPYNGNYSAYVLQREERRLAQVRSYEQQQDLIARTEDFIRRNIAGQKTKQAKSRRNMLERLERIEAVRSDENSNFGFSTGSRRAESIPRSGVNVLTISDLAVGYGGVPVAAGISLLLRRGDRLGIVGPNGSGKTAFLRTITGELEPLEGEIIWGANTAIGYYDQDLSKLGSNSTVFEEIASVRPAAAPGESLERELRSYLARFLFRGDEVFKPVEALSGGERSRLALAKLVFGRPNVLVLDEPTNHLDIPSREALENSLMEYGGTVITVSHDRYFLDRIATEILHFEKGSATHHLGNYSDFYQYRKSRAVPDPEATPKRINRDAAARRRPSSKASRTGRPAEQIEQEINLLEQELAELARSLENPSSSWGADQYAEFGDRQGAIQLRLEELYSEWEGVMSSGNNG